MSSVVLMITIYCTYETRPWFGVVRLFIIPAGQNDGIFLAPLSSALIVGEFFFDQVQCVALVE